MKPKMEKELTETISKDLHQKILNELNAEKQKEISSLEKILNQKYDT